MQTESFERRLVGIVKVRNHTVTWASPAFVQLMGYEGEELTGRPTRIFYEDDRSFEEFWASAGETLKRGEVFGGKVRRVRKDGSLGWFDINCFRPNPGIDEHETMLIDVSDKHAALEALRESEARLRSSFLAMAEGLVFHARDGKVVEANPAAERILGVSRDQLLGRTSMDPRWRTIREDGAPYPGADHPAMVSLRSGESVRDQVMGVHSPGRGLRWISVNAQPILGDESDTPAGAIATLVDITERRDAFQRIQQLAQRIEIVREEERQQIARELHEGIAQDLFAAQLALKHLESQARGRSGVMQAYEDLNQILKHCMDSTRRMANNLRPAAFAHVNLQTALSHHVRAFSALSGLEIRISQSEAFPALDEATNLVFFRAAQELLTNVAKHGAAANVDIRLQTGDALLRLQVDDDGVGIDADALNKTGSLGLIGLRERFQSLGGGLYVQKRDPKGTSVVAFIPAPPAAP